MRVRNPSLSEFACFFEFQQVGILILTLCAVLISTGLAQAQASPQGEAHVPLPADLSGTHNGTEYKIRVPANWNGTLLVYAHGSASGSVEVAPPTFPASTLEEQLLSLGYALAGSYYKDSLKEAPLRTLALTNFFKGAVGNPQRTIVWGLSLGGDTALALIETYPGIYDGAIPVAAEAAGWPNYADFLLRYDLAYGAAFGWPSDWWGPVEDLRDDLYGNEETLIMPVFQWLTDENYGQWEFVRLVMKESPTAWWEADPVFGLSGWASVGWAGTAVRSRLEQLWGGPVAQNVGVVYSLTTKEKAYLSTLGVKADELLAWMNAHTNIAASPSARNHLAHYGTYTGALRRPVVIMQGIFDPLVVASNQAVYRTFIEASGNGDRLVQTYGNGPGHDPFSAEQYLAALAAMEHWLNTGERPDASFFPESMGFDNSFVPPPWPY